MEKRDLKALISQMTLEEKAGMCSGADFWHTKGVERLGIPQIMLSDGPHGLRKQDDKADHLGINDSIEAVCFPAGCATAASFNRELVKMLGETLGNECQAENVGVILGPAMNIKRSPLCGRNFEYYSEDPYVSSEIGSALVEGIQSKNIGTSPKHFAANNQEHHRMSSSSDLDERTFHEIYLASFEGMVRNQKPWTIMNAYNRINGTYACEHQELLTAILRDKWGFDGFVVTDWGAMNDKVNALKAGCNLEMPGVGTATDQVVVDAVREGLLDEAVLDKACEEILEVVFKYEDHRDQKAVFDREKDHVLARQVAEETMVLLKNEAKILPLNSRQKVAFIGKYAKKPRFQGGGSSHVNAYKVDAAYESAKAFADVYYSTGFEDTKDQSDEALMVEAVELAKACDVAVLFVGLPDSFESEGYDREHMQMPSNQLALIDAVTKVQPNTVVVLHNGSPIEMPWIGDVKAVLEAYLGGEAGGSVVADMLYGKVNPSGRLAETFPMRLEDTPCYLNYGGEDDHSVYSEGVFVGYRYYNAKKMPVLFPFGHGLSYTTFTYTNLKLDKVTMKDTDVVEVSVDVTNTGNVVGKEVVQLYVSPAKCSVFRPIQELKGFEKVSLQPGECKTVHFQLSKEAFAYWEVKCHDWYVAAGNYAISIGKNCEEMLVSSGIYVEPTQPLQRSFTIYSTMGEILKDPKGKMILEQVMGQRSDASRMEEQASEAITTEMMQAMMEGMPLKQALGFAGQTKEAAEQLVALINA